MKKIVSAIIAACVLLSAFPITAFAANGPSQFKFGDYYLAYISVYDVETDSGFRLYDPNAEVSQPPDGISYDLATNTITLDNFKKPTTEIYTNMMGDDLRLTINGECELGRILVYGDGYGGSLTIEGTGSLTVNADKKNYSGISLLAETSDSTLTLGKDVKVNIYGKEIAVMINATACDSLDKAVVMKNGDSPKEFIKERIEYDEPEYIEILRIEEGWTRLEGVKVTRASDPDGIYCVEIYEEDGEKLYFVKKFDGLEGYDVLTQDVSFKVDPMTEEEFESSEYSIVTDDLPIQLLYTNYEYEKTHRGWTSKRVYNAEDPDGIYCAGYVWYGTGSTDRDPDEYIIYRLVWDEGMDGYVRDESQETLYLDADEFAASPYEIVYDEIKEPKYVKYWYYNEPGEDNYEASAQVMNYSEDPDGIYVLSYTYTSTHGNGTVSTGYYIDELYYDEENDCYYRDPDGEFGTTSYDISTEDFETSGFTKAYTTTYKPQEIHYLTEDYKFEYYAYKGVQASNIYDPGAVYVAEAYHSGDPDTTPIEGYYFLRLVYDEAKGHYYEDEECSKEKLAVDELEENGFRIETAEQPIDFYSSGLVENFSMPVYTDSEGNRYLVRGNEVYNYGDFSMIDYFGKVLYVPVLNTEVSLSDLTATKMHYVTDFYNFHTKAGELTYGSGDQPGYILGDVDGDGEVTINDATTIQYYLAELLQAPLTETQKLAADFNKNGIIDISDATMIQYLLADLL